MKEIRTPLNNSVVNSINRHIIVYMKSKVGTRSLRRLCDAKKHIDLAIESVYEEARDTLKTDLNERD